MKPEFEFLCRVTGFNGDGPDDRTHDTEGLIECMRRDPEFLERTQSLREHVWRTVNRASAEALIALLVSTARYLSDVIGGDVPVLASREVINASLGVAAPDERDALLIGKAMQRAVRSQLGSEREQMAADIVAEVRRLLDGIPVRTVAPANLHLDTKDVAARLGIAEVTVARLCRRGLIDADKTAGNQWRTTEARLKTSLYLNGKRGNRNGGGNGHVE